MCENIVSFKNINKFYGDEKVLENFNLDIKYGEFLTIIGTSGSGKTTVLKLINGLLESNGGEIFVCGENIKTIDKINLRRNIGYVIQGIGLFPHMSIKKNIEYVLNLKKEDKKVMSLRSLELIEKVGLKKEMLKKYPNELSGGQRQRVGIARALASKPKILLMDEPFGAVDEITRKMLQEEILNIYKELDVTIIFVTHDIKEALKLGTRVIVMNEGKIVQSGTSSDIKNNPKNEFVKELIS
ncbi:ABC transporter ATP-binding protein [Clostridium sp. LY3-2]|uniref:ATP-binding cassette domain-containing protein n=1 Tax=Clostridium sp. LY3-2 TaxID=2942482 RepID=UPI002152CDE2|nr:ABC transporter ATP-binding protein [Clostridium sp. LY3-2]MCR6514051.1 ABC transporter ATP-binding protein [Clostridium sp. LY3-2]